MPIDFALLFLCFVASLVFAGVRLLLAGKTTAFWIDLISLFLALLVFASRNILGYKI